MGDQMVPALRFPSFGENWFYDTIGGILDKDLIYAPKDGNHGSLHPKSEDFIDEGIPFIMAKDILNGRVQTTMAVKISEAQANSLHKGFSINGDVLLTHKGSIGEIALLDNITDYIVLSPQVTYYRVKDEKYLNNRYIKAFFESPQFQKNIKILAQSGTRPYVGITEQKELRFSYPELSEQQKIADFLSSVDKKIEQLIRKKELLEKYKTGMMQKLFPKAGERHPELRFKDENGQDFPDWELKKLEDIIDFKNGKPFEDFVSEEGTYYLITLNSIDIEGNIKNHHKRVIKSDGSLKKDDIVIVLSDIAVAKLLGLCDLIPDDDNVYVLNQRMGRIRVLGKVDPSYLRYHINNNQHYFKSRGQGSSQKHIYEKDIKSLSISLPIINEQKMISAFFNELDKKKKNIEIQLSRIQTFKKGLLQQMFV